MVTCFFVKPSSFFWTLRLRKEKIFPPSLNEHDTYINDATPHNDDVTLPVSNSNLGGQVLLS